MVERNGISNLSSHPGWSCLFHFKLMHPLSRSLSPIQFPNSLCPLTLFLLFAYNNFHLSLSLSLSLSLPLSLHSLLHTHSLFLSLTNSLALVCLHSFSFYCFPITLSISLSPSFSSQSPTLSPFFFLSFFLSFFLNIYIYIYIYISVTRVQILDEPDGVL